MRILLLDNYDSFTYNLYDYLLQTGVQCTVIRNDDLSIEAIAQLDFQAAVLSPGPKRPENAGILLDFIQHFHTQVPMLGVCLGQQAIGTFFGARLVKAAVPMHGKTSVIQHLEHPLFEGIPAEISVMRYHSLILDQIQGTPLEVIAQTHAGEIMAIAHRFLPLWGVQFHPESILTPDGYHMINNWVQYLRQTAPPHVTP